MPRTMGLATTAAVTEVQLGNTTVTEVTTLAQRSVKSSSANDAAAGTGARTIRVHFFKYTGGVMTGPFSEDVTLNGTTAVAMGSGGLTFVERIEVLTAGSGGVPAGNISVFPASDGTGTAIAILEAGANQTSLGQHYVPNGKICEVFDLEGFGGNATAALVQLKGYRYAEGLEQVLVSPLACTSALPRQLEMKVPGTVRIAGPARVRMTVTPGNITSQVTRASFGWADR